MIIIINYDNQWYQSLNICWSPISPFFFQSISSVLNLKILKWNILKLKIIRFMKYFKMENWSIFFFFTLEIIKYHIHIRFIFYDNNALITMQTGFRYLYYFIPVTAIVVLKMIIQLMMISFPKCLADFNLDILSNFNATSIRN